MKKLFTLMVVSFCGIMAYAQTISMQNVTMSPGETKTTEVSISNPSNFTAFQFDLTLPKKVSIKSAQLKGSYSDREFKNQLVDQNANKYRFLSYDKKNGKLSSGEVITLTLEVAEGAETGTMTGSDMLVVKPDGTSSSATASATITIENIVNVEITAAKQAIVCSEKNLDFSNVSDVKAYIVTGYDNVSGKIWLSRVKDVPANTAVLVMGNQGTYRIPVVDESRTIYSNMLVGSLTGTTIYKNGGNGITNYILSKPDQSSEVGFYYAKESGSPIRAGGGYLPLPTTIAAAGTVGSTEEIQMNKYGMLCYYTDQSLDFSTMGNLRAYTAIGYTKSGTILLSRAMQVPANTAMLLYAPAEATTYQVPSASLQQVYSNMFVGTLQGTTIYKEQDGNVNYYVSAPNDVVGFYWASQNGTPIPAKRGWLPVPASMVPQNATSRGDADESTVTFDKLSMSLNDEVISMDLFRSLDGVGDGTTSIRSIDMLQSDDAWYNLNGQRIDTPTRKGLYIKNGKKVVVK